MDAPTPAPSGEPAWLHPHVHEPIPAPPQTDTAFVLTRPDETHTLITVADLAALPQQSATDCYIVSTGHGTSGPFRFEGVTLGDLLVAYGVTRWSYADVISADNFGTRVHHHELTLPAARPVLLALACDGKPLTRTSGLVRLIVPTKATMRCVKSSGWRGLKSTKRQSSKQEESSYATLANSSASPRAASRGWAFLAR